MSYEGGPADYSTLIFRHLDRMSDSLKHGLEVGKIKNATFLMSYYLFVLHFESLLNIRINKECFNKIKEYKRNLAPFYKASSGDLSDNIEFLEKISNWFQVLLIVANNNDFISITPKTYEEYDYEMSEAKKDERSNT